jgi:hypothetical protein
VITCDRWKEEWPKIEARLRKQAAQRRSKLRQSKIQPETEILSSVILQSIPVIEPVPVSPDSNQLDLPKQPKENPWRKFKYGRSLFQRKDLPKI